LNARRDGSHLNTRGSPYTCPPASLITRHITRRWLWPTRIYVRVNLLHPQGTIHFSPTLLHTLSQFHYKFERRSGNVPADTFRPTAKTHRHRAGSRYRHTGAFSAAITTQPFSLDILLEHSLPPFSLNRSHGTNQIPKDTVLSWRKQ